MNFDGVHVDGVMRWLCRVNEQLDRGGMEESLRLALVKRLFGSLVRTCISDPSRLAPAALGDPDAFADQILLDRARTAHRVPTIATALVGMAGAAAGAMVVWYWLYRHVLTGLSDRLIDQLWVAITLDVLAVAIVIGGAVVAISCAFAARLPQLRSNLTKSVVAAAFIASPLISGFGFLTGYSTRFVVLAAEVAIGAGVLAAAIVLARSRALRAKVLAYGRL